MFRPPHTTRPADAGNAAGLAQRTLKKTTLTLISVGVRIIPIGQQAGQDCLISLYPVIGKVSTEALTATLSELGSASMLSDLMAIKHENATPRIYRT